jgi:hypothetical protein
MRELIEGEVAELDQVGAQLAAEQHLRAQRGFQLVEVDHTVAEQHRAELHRALTRKAMLHEPTAHA